MSRNTSGLTSEQRAHYERDGYVVQRGIVSADDCSALVDQMMALHSGRATAEGFMPRQAYDWQRVDNVHNFSPLAADLLFHPELHSALSDCMDDEPEAIQTMYFFKGSEQHRHQDQYYLPGCMSAWIALVDVGPENGTILVQPGSHKGHLVTIHEMRERHGLDGAFHTFDPRYDTAVDEVYERNRSEHGLGAEVPVEISAGDVLLFHGTLIHSGGPIQDRKAFRHVLANHYLPRSFAGWPYEHWARLSFDRVARYACTPDPDFRWTS